MDTKHPLDAQKEALVELFTHARAYTNVVMVTGYAGLFALWTLQASKLAPATSFITALLLAVSVSTFVGWEIFAMLNRYVSLSALRKSVDNPLRTVEEVKQMSGRAQRLMRRLERLYHPVIFTAGGTAAAAMFVLISAFIHGMWMTEGAAVISGGGTVEFDFLSICIGGFIAGLVGVVAFRLEAKRGVKIGRRGLAQALEADLRPMAELYGELDDLWQSEKFIRFDLLDQIVFIRGNFSSDRSHLGMLEDEDIRIRLNKHYRTSIVTLSKLQDAQRRIYQAEEDKVAKSRIESEIDDLIDALRDHKQEAVEIADQLSIRFT